MDYREAQQIRKKSFGTLLAEQEGGLGASLKKTISLKSKARAEGIKQFFDPMNIAKFMTFGSNWAPAMLGKATGRKQESINFFTGARKKGEKAEQQPGEEKSTKIPRMRGTSGLDSTLEKIYTLMNKSFEDERKRREQSNNFKEENELEKLKRHRELIEAITGKPYSGKATATKVTQDSGGSLLETLLGGRAAAQTLMSVLRWFASPAGLWLLGAAGVGALLLLIREGLYKLAENTPNGRALSPAEAQSALASGNERDIQALGGREALEKIVTSGRQNALDVQAMPETTEEEKAAKKKAMLALGGEDKVKAIIADETKYEVPAPRPAGEGMADRLPFTKEQFIGKGVARKSKEEKWNKDYAPYYNDDGTKKTATPIPATVPETTTPAAPAAGGGTGGAPAASPGGAGGASPAAGPTTSSAPPSGASTAVPMASVPTSAPLPEASSQNAALSLPSAPDASSTVNNTQVSSTSANVPAKNPLPPVRNLEETFRKMIIGSTRVV